MSNAIIESVSTIKDCICGEEAYLWEDYNEGGFKIMCIGCPWQYGHDYDTAYTKSEIIEGWNSLMGREINKHDI